MRESGVPAPVRRFIASHIVSVARLEVLLLLRAAADKEWTADEVARALVTQPEAARGWLDDLVERGLARESEGVYRFAPANADAERTVDGLAESYAAYRVAGHRAHLRPAQRAHRPVRRRLQDQAQALRWPPPSMSSPP